MSCVYLLLQRERLLTELDPIAYVRMWLTVLGPFGWLVVACAWLLLIFRRPAPASLRCTGLITCFLVVHTAAVSIPSAVHTGTRFLPEDARNLISWKLQAHATEDPGDAPNDLHGLGGRR